MAPGGDLKHFQFYDVGFMMGKVMALAIAMGAYVARGCELQETEGLQDAVAAMWGEKVVMMPYPTLWDTQFGVPIQDERAELYACPRARGIPGMPEQVVSAWSFDVGECVQNLTTVIQLAGVAWHSWQVLHGTAWQVYVQHTVMKPKQ